MDDAMDNVVSCHVCSPSSALPLPAVFVCGGCSIDVSAKSIEILNEDKPVIVLLASNSGRNGLSFGLKAIVWLPFGQGYELRYTGQASAKSRHLPTRANLHLWTKIVFKEEYILLIYRVWKTRFNTATD